MSRSTLCVWYVSSVVSVFSAVNSYSLLVQIGCCFFINLIGLWISLKGLARYSFRSVQSNCIKNTYLWYANCDQPDQNIEEMNLPFRTTWSNQITIPFRRNQMKCAELDCDKITKKLNDEVFLGCSQSYYQRRDFLFKNPQTQKSDWHIDFWFIKDRARPKEHFVYSLNQ